MRPYVSFVTWGRNDGYTDGYIERVSVATACLAHQLESAGLDGEIVVSEWNPVPGRPLLLDVLKVPPGLKHVSIRGVISGPQYHQRFRGAHERGIHSSEAANVGIRRARGQFITPKASDTFLSKQAIAQLARRELDVDTMYRMDRHDVAIGDDSIWKLGFDEILTRLEALPPIHHHAYFRQMPHWDLRDLHTNACGDFLLMGSGYWHVVRGHPFDDSVLSLDIDSLVMHAAAAFGVKECRWPQDCKLFKPSHENLNAKRIVESWKPWQRALDSFLYDRDVPRFAHWCRMTFDYPKRKVRNVESLLGPSTERNFARQALRWTRGKYPIPNQPADWGLASESLEERTLCQADWEKPAMAVAQ